MLVKYMGRKSNQPYTLPVVYAQDGQFIYCGVGQPGEKVWWRNLTVPVQVTLWIRGKAQNATGHTFNGADDPKRAELALSQLLARFPKQGKSIGVVTNADGSIEEKSFRKAAYTMRFAIFELWK